MWQIYSRELTDWLNHVIMTFSILTSFILLSWSQVWTYYILLIQTINTPRVSYSRYFTRASWISATTPQLCKTFKKGLPPHTLPGTSHQTKQFISTCIQTCQALQLHMPFNGSHRPLWSISQREQKKCKLQTQYTQEPAGGILSQSCRHIYPQLHTALYQYYFLLLAVVPRRMLSIINSILTTSGMDKMSYTSHYRFFPQASQYLVMTFQACFFFS